MPNAPITRVMAACSLTLLMAGCASPSASTQSRSVASSDSPAAAATSGASSASLAPAADSGGITNAWIGPPADVTKLPIGTSKVSLTEATVGGLYSCDGGNPNGGGAEVVGPWADESAGTWDLSQKVAVQGTVSWPMASYSETLTSRTREITSNGLPVGNVTGTFPISPDDPAYAYDHNANHIAEGALTTSLPRHPVAAASPTCLGKGPVGILKNGVSVFAPLDERNRDAVVYETQDQCDGHPQQTSMYHYHDIPSCIRDAAAGQSTVVGVANDGFPIVVERDAQGDLPTNADLDECHGRTSPIKLDGSVVTMYHYSATYEFPYFIGCFRGTPSSAGQSPAAPGLTAIAARLGVTEHELADAIAAGDVETAAELLGTTPEEMANKLGVTVADIKAFIAAQ